MVLAKMGTGGKQVKLPNPFSKWVGYGFTYLTCIFYYIHIELVGVLMYDLILSN